MIDGDIIVIENVEIAVQDDKEYRLVTDKAGNPYKFKAGRGGHLKDKWPLLEESVGKAIKLKVEQFKGFDFVADFTVVADEFITQATEKAQTQQGDAREKSVAISYSKDLAVAGKIQVNEIAGYAEIFYRYITGSLQVTDETILKLMIGVESEAAKTQITQETATTGQAKVDVEVGTDEDKPKTIGEFLSWLKDNGVKAPRIWLDKEGYVKSMEVLTIKRCQELYETLKETKDKGGLVEP